MKKKVALLSVDAHYGIRYISAYLKYHGYDTVLVFLPGTEKFTENLLNQILDLCSGSMCIGVSAMSIYKKRAIELAGHLKKLEIPVICGGLFSSLEPELALTYYNYICIGEGEIPMFEFCNAVQQNQKDFLIDNIWYKNNKNEIVRNELRTAEQNVDSLGEPDYTDKNHYLLVGNNIVCLENAGNYFGPMFSMLTARGCPFSCTYCHNNRIQKILKTGKNRVRYHSIEFSINFAEYIIKKYNGIKFFWIQDDDFFSRTEDELSEFAELWKKKIRIPFFVLAAPTNISEKKTAILNSAGLFQIIMGVQSGSSNISRLYGRQFINEKIVSELDSISRKFKDKLLMKYDFIILNPFETEEDVRDTIKLIYKLTPDFYSSLNVLTFMPGTALYRYAERNLECFDKTCRIQDYIDYRYGKLKDFSNHRYLNLILCLIGQKTTKFFCGVLPRFLIPFLIQNTVIKIFNSAPDLVDKLIFFAEKIFRKYNVWHEKKYGADYQLPEKIIEYHNRKLNEIK